MATSQFLTNAKKRLSKSKEILEVDIEDAYCKHAKKRKCLAIKLIFLRKKGFPDRTTLCSGGRILFIEFKRAGKKQSPVQIIIMECLRSFGFEYHVCDKIGQAEDILDSFLNK